MSPANHIPEIVAKKGNLVIVNLQDTPLTKHAALHIYAPVDVVIKEVMSMLGLGDIPSFRLQRRVGFSVRGQDDGGVELTVRGCDSEDSELQVDTIQSIKWQDPQPEVEDMSTLSSSGPWWEPGDSIEVKVDDGTWHAATVHSKSSKYQNAWNLEWMDGTGMATDVPVSFIRARGLSARIKLDCSDPAVVPVQLSFFGHYREQGLMICSPDLSRPHGDCEEVHNLEYDLEQQMWHLVSSELIQFSDSHTNESDGASSNPCGNEYGMQHREYVVQGVMEHSEQSKKEAQALFDRHRDQMKKNLDFGPTGHLELA